MDLSMAYTLARWLHIIGVLVWMGHNYVGVIQNPRFNPIDTTDAKAVEGIFLAALKREHGIFRHASLVTLATGLFMLWHRDILGEAIALSGGHAVLGMGVWCGSAMVLNVWLVLWPHQKKVLGFVPATAEERIRCSRITFLSSRINTILSLPTLFFMISGAHGTALFD